MWKKTKQVYIYNANGTVLEKNYKIENNVDIDTESTTLYTIVNGNLTKQIENSSYSYFNGNTNVTIVNTYTRTLEYDNKNNPTKNILGLNKIWSYDELSLNNVRKLTTLNESTTNGVANPASPPTVQNYVLSYNTNDYLFESKRTYLTGLNNTIMQTDTDKYLYE